MKTPASQLGISLIEILVVVGMLSLLTVVGVPAYRNYQSHVILDRTAQEIVSAINQVRVKNTSGSQGAFWEIIFEEKSYQVVKNQQIHTETNMTGVRFVEVNVFADGEGGRSNRVGFDILTGETSHAGTIVLQDNANPTKTRVITVRTTGLVQII